MWSVVQYRRIKKDVQKQLPSPPRPIPSNSWTSQDLNQRSLEHVESGHTGSVISQPASTENNDKQNEAHPTTHNDTGKDDHILVECTSEDDPFDPRNWPLRSRAKNIAILCVLIFVQTWAGAADSLANSKASREFHVSQVAENLSTAMYLFGLGSGCLFVGPLSETVGRNPVYLTFSFVYLFFVLGTALSRNFASQIVCRFFVGLACSATLGINGASVRDQFRPVKRAFWFPIIAWVNVVREYPCQGLGIAMSTN